MLQKLNFKFLMKNFMREPDCSRKCAKHLDSVKKENFQAKYFLKENRLKDSIRSLILIPTKIKNVCKTV